jgi:hypothetical protein
MDAERARDEALAKAKREEDACVDLGASLLRAMLALDNCQARLATIVGSQCYEPEVEDERCKAVLEEAWTVVGEHNRQRSSPL